MAGKAQRQGDTNVAGGLITRGESSVLINGRPAATPGTLVTPHPPCGPKAPQHCAATTRGGSRSVLVNGKPLLTSSDKDTCSHGRSSSGSPNVVVGK
ncbi:PAAR motif [uncultured Caudovirales phage]|uniref:PAAR motif n=1 Tax=uncultured Caudovirales phage TaxID=2100421 RepID=A0A6J5LUP7_9CAUD|nr:PAAR motif [uncultured Caudovirales phage]